MPLRHIDPEGLHPVPGVLSHAVVVPEAHLVYLSGQVAWDADGEIVGVGDHGAQTEQIVRNIDVALAAAGTDRSRVVKETLYVASYTAEAASSIMSALRAGATSPPPAQTLVGVAALFDPKILVEIDIVALLL